MLPPPPVSAPPAGAAEVDTGDGLGEAAAAGWAATVAVAVTEAGLLAVQDGAGAVHPRVGGAQDGVGGAQDGAGGAQDGAGGAQDGAGCERVHVGVGVGAGGGVEHWHCPPFPPQPAGEAPAPA
jgi:hypothetical protein